MSTIIDPRERAELYFEPLSLEQYQAMLDKGILGEDEDVELVDGFLIRKVEHEGEDTLYRLSLDQYHAMIREGILLEGEPVELLDGLRVRKDRRDKTGGIMTVGPRHTLTILDLDAVLAELLAKRPAHVRAQQPVTLYDGREPEPDLSVARGRRRDYRGRHPGPSDLLTVIEVADYSLRTDRNYKQSIYASSGIPVYWIVNLNDDVVEVHDAPDPQLGRYRNRRDFRPGETIPFDVAGESVSVPVDEFLTVATD